MKTKHKLPKSIITSIATIIALALILLVYTRSDIVELIPDLIPTDLEFDGTRALQYVEYQTSLGPRTPGSSAHAETLSWIESELTDYGWKTEIQEEHVMDHLIKNIIAWRGAGEPWIIIGAHYDSRIYADQDAVEENRLLPVLGANDGASGVAVLLELARVLPTDINKRIMLIFFDAEDNGSITGWDWILGSSAFAENLGSNPDLYPDAVIILDMIGDRNLNIYKEYNSDTKLISEIWHQAEILGYTEYFIPEYKYHIYDDHVPFLELGIPAIDIIDFDYPYWHTTNDTLDKVSAESLQIVGDTIYHWLLSNQ